MAEIVDMSGKSINKPIRLTDTPEAVLLRLLEQIRTGEADIKRLVIIFDGHIQGFDPGFGTRASRMSSSEALALTSIGHELLMRTVLVD